MYVVSNIRRYHELGPSYLSLGRHYKNINYSSSSFLSLLEGDDLLNADSGLDGAADLILPAVPSSADLFRHFRRIRGEVDVGLLVAALVHEGDLPVLPDVHDVPLGAVDDGDGGAVGGGDHVLELLAGEDVGGGEVALCVPVLAGLGDGDAQYLARLALDHHVAVRCRGRRCTGCRKKIRNEGRGKIEVAVKSRGRLRTQEAKSTTHRNTRNKLNKSTV